MRGLIRHTYKKNIIFLSFNRNTLDGTLIKAKAFNWESVIMLLKRLVPVRSLGQAAQKLYIINNFENL